MKRSILSVVLGALLSAPLFAAPKVLEGAFVGVEMGDYAHLQVRDDKGKIHEFFVGNDKSFMPFLDKPEAYKNKRVRLEWHHINKQIPEAGGAMEIDEAVKISLSKPKN